MKTIILTILFGYAIYYIFHILKDLYFTKDKSKETDEEGVEYTFKEAKKVTPDDIIKETNKSLNIPNFTPEELQENFNSKSPIEQWEISDEMLNKEEELEEYIYQQELEELTSIAKEKNVPNINKEQEKLKNVNINPLNKTIKTETQKGLRKQWLEKMLRKRNLDIDVSKEAQQISSLLAEVQI